MNLKTFINSKNGHKLALTSFAFQTAKRLLGPGELRLREKEDDHARECGSYEHAALHAARTTRTRIAPPPEEAAPPTSGHQTPRTNDDARRRKDAACPNGHKAGDADRWASENGGFAPATGPRCTRGWLSFSSHASVARTATRTSPQGPASALRLTTSTWVGRGATYHPPPPP